MKSANRDRRAVVLTERALAQLARPPGISGVPSLLLWHLVQSLPVAGEFLSVTALAEQLGISRVHATNAMHGLLEQGFIIRGAKSGLLYRYQLNPAYFHLL
jgi:biotin operon repressor